MSKKVILKYAESTVLFAFFLALTVFLIYYREVVDTVEASAPQASEVMLEVDEDGFIIVSELVRTSDEVNLYAAPTLDSQIVGRLNHADVMLRTGRGDEFDRLRNEDGSAVYVLSAYIDMLGDYSLNVKKIPVYYGWLDGVRPDFLNQNGGFGFSPSKPLWERLEQHLNKAEFPVGFYLFDLGSGMSISQNAEKPFFAASTIKAANALYVYKLADDNQARLADSMAYLAYHSSIDTGIMRYEEFGSTHTIKSLLEKSLIYSDNAAYYMLLEKYGITGFNDYMRSLGCEVAGNLRDSSRWGSITPRETVMVWKEIYSYIHNGKHGDIFLEQLTLSQNAIISGALPDYTVAHKYGWSKNYYNDVAIIYAQRPYILAVFTESEGGSAVRRYIQELAVILDEIMTEYTVALTIND